MRFDIRYRCRFTYEQLVRESQNELRACPASDEYQQLISYRVQTAPSSRVLSYTDWFGTRVDAFGVREPHLVLDVVAEATVETRPRPLLTVDPRVDAFDDPGFVDAHVEYLERTPHADWGPDVGATARRQADLAGPGAVSTVLSIHRFVGSQLIYAPGTTYVGVGIDDVFARRQGVCQDFAHLAVSLCRAIGIPARYVSGYLFTVNDASGADGESDVVRVQTHAWFEAAIPGFGWLALDPTNGLEVGARHVKIGHGRDYDDVPPLRGVFAGAVLHDLEVTVDIRRLTHPAPAVVPARASEAAARLAFRNDDAALRRAEEDRHQQQQQQQQ